MQDNSRRRRALVDLKAAVAKVPDFKEISYTPKSVEEAQIFPACYIVTGGVGDRVPANLLNTLFDHEFEVLLYVYAKEKLTGQLYLELEDLIEKVLDKIDLEHQTIKTTQGYDFWVRGVETDEGTQAASGSPIAACVLTVQVKSPARDAL